MESLQEFVQFMQPNQRLDLKAVALTHILGLTGNKEGISFILGLDELLCAIFGLTRDAAHTIAKDAVFCLINLTAEEAAAIKIFDETKKTHPIFPLVQDAIQHITDPNSDLADPWTMVLSNLTRVESLVPEILDTLERDEKTLQNLVKAFTKIDFNQKKHKLHYLGEAVARKEEQFNEDIFLAAPIFCNLTQSSRGRELFCRSKYNLLDKVLPFVSFEESVVRRGGTIGILKNICFDPVYHDVLLKERDDILYAILYPLSGPEEFNDEEMEKFPIELQYLPETKTREIDPDLRKMLLECLLQLCATKDTREFLRAKGVYEILREYHKWEAKIGKDADCFLACENVVDILIKKEQEIGVDNYKDLEVPEDMTEKFINEDAAYIKDLL